MVRHRLAVVAVAAIATAAFASQLPRLRMDPDTEAYAPKGHPIRVFWSEARQRFGIGRELLVAVEATGPDGIYAPEILEGLRALTDAIRDVDGVVPTDVRSLSDSDAVVGTADGLDFVPFYEDRPVSRDDAAAVRDKVFANPVFLDRLVSRNGTIAAIVIRVHHAAGAVDPTEIYRRIAEVAGAHEIPGARILIAGNPAVEYWYGRQMAADLARIIPLSVVTVVLILFLCFRNITVARVLGRAAALAALGATWCLLRHASVPWPALLVGSSVAAMLTVRGALLSSIVVATAVVWTWGLQAMLGLPIYIAGTMVPPLLLAIGCADGIHVLERYFERAARGGTPREVVVDTMRAVAPGRADVRDDGDRFRLAGPDKAMVSAIALGIGIDYSIHLMARFRDLVASGLGVDEAIVEAMRTTGRAIFFNALVVVAGFSILGFSRSPSNATFGLMVASNMAVACVAALLILPAALTILAHLGRTRAGAAAFERRVVRRHPRLARVLHLQAGVVAPSDPFSSARIPADR